MVSKGKAENFIWGGENRVIEKETGIDNAN